MRYLLFAIALVLVVSLVISGQALSISSPKLDEFTIGLASNPTTGYNWHASFDTRKVELVEQWYVQDGSSVVYQDADRSSLSMSGDLMNHQGMGGTSYFKFKLKTKRWATVTFVYKRAWEDTILDKKVFRVKG